MGTTQVSERRRWWVYIRAVLVGAVLGWAVYLGMGRIYAPPIHIALTRGFYARFAWDSAHRFQTFELMDDETGTRVSGRLWRRLVAAQAKPELASYLRRAGFTRATGWAGMRVVRLVPLVVPDFRGGSLNLDTDVTPLMRAADKGDLDLVLKLLAGGADVNAKDWTGATALLHAFGRNTTPNVVKALLAAGADANARNSRRDTPLILAALTARGKDRSDVLRELLAAGAEVNAKDENGATALMMAAADGDADAVKLLLKSGAEVNVRCIIGESALSSAERYKHPEVAKMLRQAGAKM